MRSQSNRYQMDSFRSRLEAAPTYSSSNCGSGFQPREIDHVEWLLFFLVSALDYLRSSVLRMVLNAIKEINQKSGKVVLCCLSGYVMEIFEVNRFRDGVAITDSIESCIEEVLRGLKAA